MFVIMLSVLLLCRWCNVSCSCCRDQAYFAAGFGYGYCVYPPHIGNDLVLLRDDASISVTFCTRLICLQLFWLDYTPGLTKNIAEYWGCWLRISESCVCLWMWTSNMHVFQVPAKHEEFSRVLLIEGALRTYCTNQITLLSAPKQHKHIDKSHPAG